MLLRGQMDGVLCQYFQAVAITHQVSSRCSFRLISWVVKGQFTVGFSDPHGQIGNPSLPPRRRRNSICRWRKECPSATHAHIIKTNLTRSKSWGPPREIYQTGFCSLRCPKVFDLREHVTDPSYLPLVVHPLEVH